jgi:hypothetical protein
LQWRALDTADKSTASPGAETDVNGKGLSVQILLVTLCSAADYRGSYFPIE